MSPKYIIDFTQISVKWERRLNVFLKTIIKPSQDNLIVHLNRTKVVIALCSKEINWGGYYLRHCRITHVEQFLSAHVCVCVCVRVWSYSGLRLLYFSGTGHAPSTCTPLLAPLSCTHLRVHQLGLCFPSSRIWYLSWQGRLIAITSSS